MKINLEIENLVKSPVEKIPFEKTAKTVLKEQAIFLKNKTVSFNLTFVGEEEIRKLNKEYRKQDKSTDILSFSEYKNLKEIKSERNQEVFLGELILCYDDIEKYALYEKRDLQKEILKIFVHGILHLIGFEHGRKMFFLQNELIKKFF